MRRLLLAFAVLLAGCASVPRSVGQRPYLEVSAHPRMAFGPLRALLQAQLKGGDDVEDLYCPRIEWNFGDGSNSVRESDCAPWTLGTVLERRFSISHCYRTAGEIPVTVTLWHANRKLLEAGTVITVVWSPGTRPC